MRVCSYELGILVWPSLFGDGVKMVPVFKHDAPKLKECVSDVKVSRFCVWLSLEGSTDVKKDPGV